MNKYILFLFYIISVILFIIDGNSLLESVMFGFLVLGCIWFICMLFIILEDALES